jgi:hypothetical protein
MIKMIALKSQCQWIAAERVLGQALRGSERGGKKLSSSITSTE